MVTRLQITGSQKGFDLTVTNTWSNLKVQNILYRYNSITNCYKIKGFATHMGKLLFANKHYMLIISSLDLPIVLIFENMECSKL